MSEHNLFWNCEEWRLGHCKNGLENSSRPGGEEFFEDDPGIRVNGNGEWDAVCELCDTPLEIAHRKCPVCDGLGLMMQEIPYYEVDSLGVYNYVCKNCGRQLYIYVHLNRQE